ncbi:AraC family transcriptional regulator [Chelativorans xinjiangense]|uniref:AraC family transcriptional regulator n=1 Tax=Chelativorans xinjiangense TaxID=2681485 RepID=UPI001359B52C|nr:AraC family transcriptional regulator [Chelativorans xinjiangense]
MDKIEGGVLAGIPENALKLTLTRSTIKMQHSRTWRVDKSNSVHDLVICLTGSGSYMVDDGAYTLAPGDAMLIPAGSRFVGWHASGEAYTGVAQHFTLDLFGKHDLIAQMRINRAVRFSRWPLLEPVVRYYHDIAPASSTTLIQHHLFMFILIEFLEDAFIAWNAQPVSAVGNADGISLGIMLAATRITADPLDEDIAERVVADAPYNPDYFKREFRRQIGWTPRKFQEFKRMERAMNLLASGNTVGETAALVGYCDVYYFSRMFKRHIGTSPAGYKLAVRESQDGKFPRGEEDGQVIYPLVERVE